MIHVTIHGMLVADAYYSEARRDRDHSHPARVSFTLSVRRGADNQLIACRMYGTRATSVEPHLVEGKRVIVSGHLRLPKGDGLARLSVDLCQLVGGTRTIRDHEDDPHEDEGEIER